MHAVREPFGPRGSVTSIWMTIFWIVRFVISKVVNIVFLPLISVMLNFRLGEHTDWKNSSTCSLIFVLKMLKLSMIFGGPGDFFRHFIFLMIASVFRVLSNISWHSFGSCFEELVLRFSSFWTCCFRSPAGFPPSRSFCALSCFRRSHVWLVIHSARHCLCRLDLGTQFCIIWLRYW